VAGTRCAYCATIVSVSLREPRPLRFPSVLESPAPRSVDTNPGWTRRPTHRPLACERPLIERQSSGGNIRATLIQCGRATRYKVLAALVSDVGFGRSQWSNQLLLRSRYHRPTRARCRHRRRPPPTAFVEWHTARHTLSTLRSSTFSAAFSQHVGTPPSRYAATVKRHNKADES
jgi:hypothetical protein